MLSESDAGSPSEQSADSPTDGFLITSLLRGDSAALRKLMDRYDRLVRYTVFRVTKSWCLKDPQWLDSVASEAWTGFVQSLKHDPDNPPKSLRAYLVRIAYNKAISATRWSLAEIGRPSVDVDGETEDIASTLEKPEDVADRLEQLAVLRECLAELGPEDQRVAGQLEAITRRRWREAAEALGLKESTLRSRWQRIVADLADCIKRKTRKNFAPPPGLSDI